MAVETGSIDNLMIGELMNRERRSKISNKLLSKQAKHLTLVVITFKDNKQLPTLHNNGWSLNKNPKISEPP